VKMQGRVGERRSDAMVGARTSGHDDRVNHSGRAHSGRWLWVLGVGLACWTPGFLYHWIRPSLWILDLVLVPVMALLLFGGLAVTVLAVVKLRPGVAAAMVPMILATALVSPGYRVFPRAYFTLHRPLFEIARQTPPGADYYGNPLPLPLRFLSANGNVSRVIGDGRDVSDIRFLPQWIGIPDDAGGYLYSPDGSPAGVDMYGMVCREPVDLGGDWWMCGL
jgi:hypothetical protein